VAEPLTDHVIDPFRPLLTRIEKEKIDAMLEDAKEHLEPTAPAKPASEQPSNVEPIAPEIAFDDFAKIDLRIARTGPGGQDLFLLSPDTGARPGMRVK